MMALTNAEETSAFGRALKGAVTDWAQNPPDAYLAGEAVLRTEARVPFRGWRMVAFTAYDSVRERVNGVMALEIMGFAILAALTFYMLSRRAWSQTLTFQPRIGGTAPVERPPAAAKLPNVKRCKRRWKWPS